MKVWQCEHTFDHPWEKIVYAAWRKYPNPMNPAVIGTDVVERKVVDGVLVSHRLVSSQWGFPRWASSIVGSTNICYASEQSECDPRARNMVLKTKNLTFGPFISVDETVSYSPHPNDNSKTLLKQQAIVSVIGIPLNGYVEDLLASKISANAGKGRQAIEWVIDKINAEVKDITTTAVKSNDETLTQTKRFPLDDITISAKKSMDDISNAAKKSFDAFNSFAYITGQFLPKF